MDSITSQTTPSYHSPLYTPKSVRTYAATLFESGELPPIHSSAVEPTSPKHSQQTAQTEEKSPSHRSKYHKLRQAHDWTESGIPTSRSRYSNGKLAEDLTTSPKLLDQKASQSPQHRTGLTTTFSRVLIPQKTAQAEQKSPQHLSKYNKLRQAHDSTKSATPTSRSRYSNDKLAEDLVRSSSSLKVSQSPQHRTGLTTTFSSLLSNYTPYLRPSASEQPQTDLKEDNSFTSPQRPANIKDLSRFKQSSEKILASFGDIEFDPSSRFIGNTIIPTKKPSPLLDRLPYSCTLQEAISTEKDYDCTETDSPAVSITSEERISPTARFLSSEIALKEQDYLSIYIDELPLEKMIQKENDLLHSHAVVYTGQSKAVYLIHMFNQQLLSLIMQGVETKRRPEDIIWLRNPLARIPIQQIFPDAPSYLHLYGDAIVDNKERSAWNLISCSPYLFSNVLVEAMESTLDYWWDDNNVMPPNFATIFHEVFDTLNILTGENGRELRSSFINRLIATTDILHASTAETEIVETKAVETEEVNTHGVILQIFVPHEEVNQSIYISRANGVPDQNHPNALASLLEIQTEGGDQTNNYSSMQARLLTGRFINPNLDIDYKAFAYGSFTDEGHAQFKEAVRQLVLEILYTGHSLPFPVLPREKDDSNSLAITTGDLPYLRHKKEPNLEN